MRVKFDGDAKGLGRAAEQGEKSLSKFQKAAGKLGDFGKKATDMLGKGMKSGALAVAAIGVGIGAAVVKGVQEALEQGQIKAKLAAQLGAEGDDAKRLGKLTGGLFKDGYGESFGDVAGMLKTVFEQGLVSLKDTDAQIKDVTASVATYTTLTGEDAVGATRAVAQMVKTGLAKNAEEAFDILVRGQQLGINKSEDLLDTFNEYGTQFRKLGLSATDSLGLMNQLIQGGARDSDVAADAIKEFSIRAIDGSKTTADGFKSLKLDTDKMVGAFAKGGPAARTAFGDVLDALNGIKDPVERNRIGVELFGTQWEDLGGAIKNADLDTAAASVGKVAGATEKANAALSDNPAAKLEKVKRMITQTFVDALGKYALPMLEKFADWFNGPGKFVIVGWALDSASAFLGFADKMLGALQSLLGGLAKYAKIALIAAAGTVAAFNPSLALDMLGQANALEGWAESASASIDGARGKLHDWQSAVDSKKNTVKLNADVADAQQKLDKTKAALEDPKLTKERRAQLTADRTRQEAELNKALIALGDPALIKARVAKLTADKTDADAKIKANLKALKDPKLSATKRAKLEAENKQLLQKKKEAQAAIDALHGKTVPINASVTVTAKINAASVRAKVDQQLARAGYVPGHASGGPVFPNRSYLVGERGPEILTMGSNGSRIMNAEQTAQALAGGGSQPIIVENHIEIGGEVVRVVRTEIKSNEADTKRRVQAGVR